MWSPVAECLRPQSGCSQQTYVTLRNIKPTLAYVNNMRKRRNIFIFPEVPKNVNSPTPPHPVCNVASCWFASANERYNRY